MNIELCTLYVQDQADRQGKLPADLHERDQIRLQRVTELLAAGAVQRGIDFFHAAMLFQHGKEPEHYWQAFELARQATVLGYRRARWLTAAAYDRWLLSQGKRQKYGTQYISYNGGPFQLQEVDPATTDEERIAWDVLPLAAALRHAKEIGIQYTSTSIPEHQSDM